MSVQRARVTKLLDSEFAEVEMSPTPPTEHACCGGQMSPSLIRMKARNGIKAAAGASVLVESGSAASMGPLLAAMFTPLVIFIIGYAVWEPWGGTLGLLGLPISWWIIRATAESRAVRIVSVDNNSPESY